MYHMTVSMRRYFPVETPLRIFFVPKYDLAKNFFTVWPADRESETIIPSTGASSQKTSCLLFCWQPLKDLWVPLAATGGPLVSNSLSPLLSHSFIQFSVFILKTTTAKVHSLKKCPLWIIATIIKSACCMPAWLNYINSMSPSSSVCQFPQVS